MNSSALVIAKSGCACMPGNELEVARYIFSNIGAISLNHLGIVQQLGYPFGSGIRIARSIADIGGIAPDDSSKKADVYINGQGVSIKQIGGSFAFNRLQRKNLLDVFRRLEFQDPESCISSLDSAVMEFHRGLYPYRNRAWQDFFGENEFRALMEYLMMKGSPNLGESRFPAEYILEAPASGISESCIRVYTFGEYFCRYKNKFVIAIRRVWKGQRSNSEHNRALSITGEIGNAPWVFDTISGSPRTGWRSDFPVSERRTAYYLMIEKIR